MVHPQGVVAAMEDVLDLYAEPYAAEAGGLL